jgi:hypothetical protein
MRTVAASWLFFLVTGIFISLIVPLGEGFDEPYHFSYVQYVAQTGKLPSGPSMRISREIESFMLLHPVGWRLKDIFRDLHSQEEYWHDPNRAEVDATLRSMRFSGEYREGQREFSKQYESHQAPLHYLLSAPLFYVAARRLSFVDTFLLMRLWSVFLASAVVPLSYVLATRLSGSDKAAAVVPILVAMFPGIYPDVVRVSNDALAVPVAALIFILLANHIDSNAPRAGLLLSAVMTVGLLTKAFFVPVFAVIVLVMLSIRRYRSVLTMLLLSIVGWLWFARNLLVTGSLTGLPETVAANTTVASSINALSGIDWYGLLRLAAVSHIWMGYWSLLQFRSWMYDTVLILFAVGLCGFMAFMLRSASRGLVTMFAVYVGFACALIYYATQVFLQTGIPVIQGWYLSPMIPLEALAFVLGLQTFTSRRMFTRTSVFTGFCFLALTIYGHVFIAAPYYANLTEHAASGHLRAYHPRWGDILIAAERLTRFHPWIPSVLPVFLGVASVLLGLRLLWSCLRSADYST